MKDKPVILVVDDQFQNIELLEAYLVPQGYEIIEASSGEEALEKLSHNSIDLVLLDIMMPGMSGIEVLEKLRADEKTRFIPVVMVTVLKETEDKVKALEAGCDDFISKPFNKVELLARVKSILKISYYLRQLDEKEKFKAVISEMGDGVIVCGKDWNIKSINSSALKYLNIAETNGIGFIETIFDNYSVSISKEDFLSLSVFNNKFDIVRGETIKTKPFYLAVNKNVLKDSDGEVTNIVFTLRDVSGERREDYLKQNFLGVISHKLRTPLAVINGDILLLRDGLCGSLTEKQKEIVDAVSRESFLLISLVEKILGFTMVYSQKLDQSKETLKLKAYLLIIINSIIRRAENKKIELSIDCQEDLQLEINKIYFDQVMGNLIENAIKFNDKDVARISIIVKKMSKKIEISVSDNGPGIPNEEYDRIFDKFYQAEKYFTGQVEGAGLGLAIVKRLIEGSDGKIQVKSNLGQGSTFTLLLDYESKDT